MVAKIELPMPLSSKLEKIAIKVLLKIKRGLNRGPDQMFDFFFFMNHEGLTLSEGGGAMGMAFQKILCRIRIGQKCKGGCGAPAPESSVAEPEPKKNYVFGSRYGSGNYIQ